MERLFDFCRGEVKIVVAVAVDMVVMMMDWCWSYLDCAFASLRDHCMKRTLVKKKLI